MNKKLLLSLTLISTHTTHSMLVRTTSQTTKKPLISTHFHRPLHDSQTKPNDPITNEAKQNLPLSIDEKLYNAARDGSFESAHKYIVENKHININWRNEKEEGKSALTATLTSPYLHYGTAQQEISSLRNNFVYMIGLLMRNGANPYQRDNNKKHAFIYINEAIQELENKQPKTDHSRNQSNLAFLDRIKNTLEEHCKAFHKEDE
jgi:hypothetical protein